MDSSAEYIAQEGENAVLALQQFAEILDDRFTPAEREKLKQITEMAVKDRHEMKRKFDQSEKQLKRSKETESELRTKLEASEADMEMVKAELSRLQWECSVQEEKNRELNKGLSGLEKIAVDFILDQQYVTKEQKDQCIRELDSQKIVEIMEIKSMESSKDRIKAFTKLFNIPLEHIKEIQRKDLDMNIIRDHDKGNTIVLVEAGAAEVGQIFIMYTFECLKAAMKACMAFIENIWPLVKVLLCKFVQGIIDILYYVFNFLGILVPIAFTCVVFYLGYKFKKYISAS